MATRNSIIEFSTWPAKPIQETGDTEVSDAYTKDSLATYIGLTPRTNAELQKWISLPINVKYFTILAKWGPMAVSQENLIKALRWLRMTDADIERTNADESKTNITVVDHYCNTVEETLKKFSNMTKPLDRGARLACVLYHWQDELRDWELGQPQPTREDNDKLYGEWETLHELKWPAQYRHPDLKPDSMPRGHAIENTSLPGLKECDLERYNRLFCLNRYVKSSIGSKSKWTSKDGKLDGMFTPIGPKSTDGEAFSGAPGPKWCYAVADGDADALPEDPIEAAAAYHNEVIAPVVKYKDLPCSLKLMGLEQVKEWTQIAAKRHKTAGRGRLPTLRDVAIPCEHPGKYENQGHWRQRIRDEYKFSGYEIDIEKVDLVFYGEDGEESDDWAAIYGMHLAWDQAKVAVYFNTQPDNMRAVFEIHVDQCDGPPDDEGGGLPGGLGAFLKIGADGDVELSELRRLELEDDDDDDDEEQTEEQAEEEQEYGPSGDLLEKHIPTHVDESDSNTSQPDKHNTSSLALRTHNPSTQAVDAAEAAVTHAQPSRSPHQPTCEDVEKDTAKSAAKPLVEPPCGSPYQATCEEVQDEDAVKPAAKPPNKTPADLSYLVAMTSLDTNSDDPPLTLEEGRARVAEARQAGTDYDSVTVFRTAMTLIRNGPPLDLAEVAAMRALRIRFASSRGASRKTAGDGMKQMQRALQPREKDTRFRRSEAFVQLAEKKKGRFEALLTRSSLQAKAHAWTHSKHPKLGKGKKKDECRLTQFVAPEDVRALDRWRNDRDDKTFLEEEYDGFDVFTPEGLAAWTRMKENASGETGSGDPGSENHHEQGGLVSVAEVQGSPGDLSGFPRAGRMSRFGQQ
ncbi:hypothetical protein LTR36_001834 [Oleoguttula mirabilis]|uniref:Uncharacterized protein n=1 Tax=Oleoguttula mirabilis TaxID=1507867 RepID=A0AAV9JNE4_9PEZI|nr:hypothetical protein LTR36_001834 [Oleoguttula mirabilis]